MKKFELIKGDTLAVDGRILYRIRALTAIGVDVKAGELGGYIECESNLGDDAWVSGNALVYGDARVFGKARVYGYEKARVYGKAKV